MSILQFLIAFFLATGFSSAVHAQNSEPDRHADAVQALINDGEYENAIARVEAALKDHGKSERLQLQKGLILVQLGDLDKAVSHYRKLLKRFRNNPEPGNNLAMVYRYQKKYGKAIDLFRATIKRFPEYVQARENLGDTYVQMALREFEDALAASPDNERLESKVDTTNRFDELARTNTAAERRRILAGKQTADNAIAELNRIKQAQLNALADPTEQILGTLEAWVTAVSVKNSDAYLAHYSQEFMPGGNLTLQQWIDKRQTALVSANYIRLAINQINLSRTDTDRVVATFIENYESDIVRTRMIKSLTFRRYDDGRWLIVREESRPDSGSG